jgi:anthranilate/para-aminobenzoate synthase component I
MHPKPFSSLFLDSGGGWLNGKEEAFILFKSPSFSLFTVEGSTTVVLPEGRFNTSRSPLSLLDGYLGEGYIAVGYLGYEFSRFTENGLTVSRQKEGYRFPDTYFLFYKQEDMISGEIKDLIPLIETPSQKRLGLGSRDARPGSLYSNMTKDKYVEMVLSVKEYIASGDVYQVNLSQRFTTLLNSPPISYLLDLYNVQPVPFGCYIDFGYFLLVSGSMELFVRKIGRKVATKPIKGTRKRAFTTEEDALLRAELLSSDKERAENLMIVDLMRNDLGRICQYGTVKVSGLFRVESYSTVHQLVSEVEGLLNDGIKTGDIINATFPPGSVTGAPKRRAMEVIDELEPHLRGPYCGALGIFMPNGDFTLSVAIRILTIRELNGSDVPTSLRISRADEPVLNKAEGTFWVGGGIVWDSDPEKEYEETLIKARAINKALGIEE